MSALPEYKRIQLDHEQIALVLQGGGALGAYQAGVFEELAKVPHEPHWVAGVSIGAINSALIVGNPPERRVARLREFWDLVSSGLGDLAPMWDGQRKAFHQFSAAMAASFGVANFYKPWVPPPAFRPEGSPGAISVYDTSPLRVTLERLVDFDLINSKKLRLSVGAVDVRTGNSVYFDNTEREIRVEHIMASGALPPAFAPVMIEGDAYWDGGIVSNTPLQYVLDHCGLKKTMVVQVDLFSARGELPRNLGEVATRQKDIMYSSRTRFNTDKAAEIQADKRAIHNLIAKLPASLKNDPDVKRLAEASRAPHIDIVHMIYRERPYELESKDYEFSRSTMLEHWKGGQRDMRCNLSHPDLLSQSSPDDGITMYDLTDGPVKVRSGAGSVARRRAKKH